MQEIKFIEEIIIVIATKSTKIDRIKQTNNIIKWRHSKNIKIMEYSVTIIEKIDIVENQ